MRVGQRGRAGTEEDSAEDLVLREEARKGENAGDRQCRRQHQHERPRHVAPQPAHVPHVLGVLFAVRRVIRAVHRENHGTGAEKQQRLEEGVRHEMKNARHVRA